MRIHRLTHPLPTPSHPIPPHPTPSSPHPHHRNTTMAKQAKKEETVELSKKDLKKVSKLEVKGGEQALEEEKYATDIMATSTC